MTDDKAANTGQLMRSSNEKCRQLTYASVLKQKKAKCPYCGKQVWETERPLK